MSDPRVLVLVLSADAGVYEQMTEVIRATWGRGTRDDFRVIYYYGRRPHGPHPPQGGVVQEGDVMVADIPAGMYSILPETLMVYDHVRRTLPGYDYLYRCCAGSYLVRDELLSWVRDKLRERFYAGVHGAYGESTWHFASGSGYFLSRDLVDLIVDHAGQILSYYPADHYMDDVAVGRFLAEQGVNPADAPRVDDSIVPQIGQYHYHLGAHPERMLALHQALTGDRA